MDFHILTAIVDITNFLLRQAEDTSGDILEAARDVLRREMAFFIERGIRLRDVVIVFFIGSQIHHVIRDARILGIALVDDAVRRLDEAVLIDAGIGSQGVDQTDVRTFGSLDGAHAAVMAVVNVADFDRTAGCSGP